MVVVVVVVDVDVEGARSVVVGGMVGEVSRRLERVLKEKLQKGALVWKRLVYIRARMREPSCVSEEH